MKITDKRNIAEKNPVPDFGDLLKVFYKCGDVDTYVVVPARGDEGKLLLDIESYDYWEISPASVFSTVEDFKRILEDDGSFPVEAIDHIPSSQLELVIGG